MDQETNLTRWNSPIAWPENKTLLQRYPLLCFRNDNIQQSSGVKITKARQLWLEMVNIKKTFSYGDMNIRKDIDLTCEDNKFVWLDLRSDHDWFCYFLFVLAIGQH